MSNVQLRDVTPTDVEAVLALNNASVPNVNHVSYETMCRYVEHAPYFRVGVIDDQAVGFLVGLTPEVPYDSPNFLKFKEWFTLPPTPPGRSPSAPHPTGGPGGRAARRPLSASVGPVPLPHE